MTDITTQPPRYDWYAAQVEAQRVAGSLCAVIVEGPLRRSLEDIDVWRSTHPNDIVTLKRLATADLDLILRRRLLATRKDELETARRWSQHVALAKMRSAVPLDEEAQVRAFGAAVLVLARLARSTSVNNPHRVSRRGQWLLETAIVPMTPSEQQTCRLIIDGLDLEDARV